MAQVQKKSEITSPSTEGQKFKISLFDNKIDNLPKLVERTWSELCEHFAKPAVRASKDGTLFSGASFDGRRAKENVTEISLLTLDYDRHAAWARDLANWQALGFAFAAHTTHSHQRITDDHPRAEDRFRVVVPLATPISPDLFPALWQWAFAVSGGRIDRACKDASRMVYTPAKAHSGAPYAHHIEAGELLDWRKLNLAETAKQVEKQAPQEKPQRLEKYAETALEAEVAKVASAANGSRNATLNQAAFALGQLVGAGALPEWSAVSKLTDAARFVGLSEAETRQTLASGLEAGKKQPRDLPKPILDAKPATTANQSNNSEQGKIPVVCLADVEAEEVEWLWYPYIPKRKITLMTGQEGIGKSWLTCAIVAAITNGKGLPETTSVERGSVLMLSAEDGLADTVKPRLVASGADCTRVFAPTGKLTFDEKGLRWFSEMIAEYRPVLVVIDPLFAYTGAKIDINKANEARSISSQLADIAEKLDTSLLLIRHFNKAKGNGDSRQAGMSSIDWRAAARVELLVGVDPDDPSKRSIIHDKHNLSEQGKSLGFTIRDGQFLWTGESHLTVARMLSSGGNEEETQGRNDAVDFLRQLLEDGPIEAEEVEKARRKAGVSDYSLRQAKRSLGIKPVKTGFGKASKWQWGLPADDTEEDEESITPKDVESAAKAAKALKKNENQRLWVNGNGKSSYGNDLLKGVENPQSQRLSAKISTPLGEREVFEV